MMGWNILNFKLLSCVANVNTLYVQCFTLTSRVICWCTCPRKKKPWYQAVLIKNSFQVLKVLFYVCLCFRKFVPKQTPPFIDTTFFCLYSLKKWVSFVSFFCFPGSLLVCRRSSHYLNGLSLSLDLKEKEVISETVVLHAKLSQWQSKSNWNGQKSFYGNETLIKNLLYQNITK